LFLACGVAIACVVWPAQAQNLTAADAPGHPIVEPSSGNLTCAQGHYLPWLDQNWCLRLNQINIISKDPSALLNVTVGGTMGAGHTVTLNFIVNGTTRAVTYVTQSGDNAQAVATGLVAAIKANGNLYSSANGGLPGPITYVTNTDNGLSATVSLDYDSRQTVALSWSSTGSETLTYASACSTSCPKQWDNNPSITCGRMPDGGMAPPQNSVICNWMTVGSQSSNPSVINVQYENQAPQILSSTSGSLLARRQFCYTGFNSTDPMRCTYIGYEGVYPASDNAYWSGHQNYRWQYVWSYIGDFATGLTVNNLAGLTATKTIRAAGGASDCTLVFTGGILTGGTC
jgi:hypothetical protein